MHVGVKEAVAEHLREEDLDAGARELGDVHALAAQLLHLAHRRAAHSLHRHDRGRAPVPIHLRDDEQRRVREIPPQLARVRRLAHQVELLGDVAREFRDDLARLQAPPVGREALDQTGRGIEERQVLRDHRLHPGPQDLDRRFPPAGEHGDVDLRHRCARHRLRVELLEYLGDRLAERALDLGDGELSRKRRHLVLELGQLVGEVGGQQIAARREHLSELDEDRSESFERAAQPHRARLGEPAEEQQRAKEPRGAAIGGERELVEPESKGYPQDLGEAEQGGISACRMIPAARCASRAAPCRRVAPRPRA